MSKQVDGGAAQCATAQQSQHLYITANTYDSAGKNIGTRVVDMYHYGTRAWLQNHLWWAMHNHHEVVTQPATGEEVESYLASAKNELAAKYQAA